MTSERPHFVTGRLASSSLDAVLNELAEEIGLEFSVDVLPITVAALMTPAWIARHISVPATATKVILPGYCGGELESLRSQVGIPVECGPRDLRELPAYFGRASARDDYGEFDIEILAEINHAPRHSIEAILEQAHALRKAGADIIDVGCDPGHTWQEVSECVAALREAGHRVSIDSMNVAEISAAVAAGAELVLSVNASNREAAVDWGCEVVAIPDDPKRLTGLDETIQWLEQHSVSYRIDPILEPIGFGFAASLQRYQDVRNRYPNAELMMGIGNLTELTDCDSAGINVLLLGFCQELGIRSVLTTQVINWARSSVAECDLARRLVHYAINHQVLPKHLESQLVMLRDPKVSTRGEEFMHQLAEQVRDRNIRLYAESGKVHAVTADWYDADPDPFSLFERLVRARPESIDASHAFYLGFEMGKAATANTLGKQYEQDESLNWGMLTVPEESHRLKRTAAARPPEIDEGDS